MGYRLVSSVLRQLQCWLGYRVDCGELSRELSWFIVAFSVVFGLVVARRWLR
jgi:hypothetical protein